MAEWSIDVTATLPASADNADLTVLSSSGTTFQPTPSTPGNYSFTYNDADGATFILIFELVDSLGDSIGAQPIAHGPYAAADVGTELGGGK